MTVPARRLEQDLQRTVAQWLDIQQRLGRLLWYAVPNGGARSKTEAAIFKGLGVKAGVPDIAIVLPGGRAAFIELKAGRAGLSPAQLVFADLIFRIGAEGALCRSLDEVIAAVNRWKYWKI